MSEHLPECRWNWPCRDEDWTHEPMEENEWVCCECGNDCLCRELEACEQRALRSAVAAIEAEQRSFPDDPYVRIGLGIAKAAVNKRMEEKT